MKIWAISDLHQEFLREPSAAANPLTRFDLAANVPADADVVAIAGDLDVSLEASLRRIADELPDMMVIYTPGNHDFYVEEGSTDQYTMAGMKMRGWELAQYFGIQLLMDDSFVFEDVRFIGATLWSDFQLGRGHLASKTHEAAGRSGMNDYKRIKRPSSLDPTKRKRLRPQDTILEHQKSRAYFERTLAEPHEGQTVVITHHAPHRTSLDPRYSSLEYCYASDMSLLLESDIAPDVWIHGHIHAARDYTVGKTRVVANPRGYTWDSDLDNGFDPGLLIEVDSWDPKPGW